MNITQEDWDKNYATPLKYFEDMEQEVRVGKTELWQEVLQEYPESSEYALAKVSGVSASTIRHYKERLK